MFDVVLRFVKGIDYQFDLLFNPAFLQVNGVSDGGFLTSGGGTSVFGGAFLLTLDNTTGFLTILDSLQGPVPPATGVSGSGILASISFTALATGVSAIGLANLTLEDFAGDPLAPLSIDGSVNVSSPETIPEPATLLLVGSGLLVAARTAKRRRVMNRRDR